MLKRLLLMLSAAGWARWLVTHLGVARRVAHQFVAGETLDEAVARVTQLNAAGLSVTLDYLGESVRQAADTEPVVAMYLRMIDRIRQEALDASVSLKLTHLGLDISEELCVANLGKILAATRDTTISVTIDMESSAYTGTTLRLYRQMRDEGPYPYLGIVTQAYLMRTQADMDALAAEGARVRLCKGAYLEPPDIAFASKAAVDANFITLATRFLDHPGDGFLAIATHDEAMIAACEAHIAGQHIAGTCYEFQMLYGIRSARQVELARNHAMRVYVPFGEAWYPYFMRRLAERPANLVFFVKHLLRLS
jgi:proline dehydrogenase